MLLHAKAVLASVIFLLVPFGSLSSSVKNVIGIISRFTPGIYCMHRLIEAVLHAVIGTNPGSFSWCVMIYAVSLCVSFAVSLVAGKYSKYLVG